MSNPVPLVILGGGGHCRSCIDVIESTGEHRIVGIVDRDQRVGEQVLGYSFLGRDSDLEKIFAATPGFIVGLGQVGQSRARRNLFELALRYGGNPLTVISASARIARTAQIGPGSVVMHNTLVNSQAVVGQNCIVNSNSIIEHDVILGDHSVVSTSVTVNGGVTAGSGVFLGSGSVVFQEIELGDNAIVGGGCTVRNNIKTNEKHVYD